MRRVFLLIDPVHLQECFYTWAVENQFVLGQIKVNEKSNEITAIPKLLGLLDVSGYTVTIDAMSTQKAIAKGIVDKEADYIWG